MPKPHSVTVVEAWQDAVNHQDIDRLLALSDPEIKLIGPRGSGTGHQLLRDWLARAGLRLETLRIFARGNVVALLQHGVWRSPETGYGEQDVVSSFLVAGERIVQYARYDSLDAGLAEAGLSHVDEYLE